MIRRSGRACSLVYLPWPATFPVVTVSSRLRQLFSRGRSALTHVQPARSPHHHLILFTESPDSFSLPLLPLRSLPGGANRFRSGSCTRRSPAPFTARYYANWPRGKFDKVMSDGESKGMSTRRREFLIESCRAALSSSVFPFWLVLGEIGRPPNSTMARNLWFLHWRNKFRN